MANMLFQGIFFFSLYTIDEMFSDALHLSQSIWAEQTMQLQQNKFEHSKQKNRDIFSRFR